MSSRNSSEGGVLCARIFFSRTNFAMPQQDDWSSLDESAASEVEIIESSGNDEASSTSDPIIDSTPADDDYSSSSSESSDIPTREHTPQVGAKRARQSALDSLIKKRKLDSANKERRSISSLDEQEEDVDSSHSDVSDSDASELSESSSSSSCSSDISDSSSSSSGSVPDPSFYVRMNAKLDRKDDKDRAVADSLSVREAFTRCVQSYALRIARENNNKSSAFLQKVESELNAGLRKTEKAVLSRRDIMRPSHWKPDQLFVQALQSFPEMKFFRFPPRDSGDRECQACGHKSFAFGVQFRGEMYDSQALWQDDWDEWLERHGGGHTKKKKSKNISTPSKTALIDPYEMNQYTSGILALGTTCAGHARAFHALQHLKAWLLDRVVQFMHDRNLTDPEETVRRLNTEKDGIVERWFTTFEDAMNASEKDVMASSLVDDNDVLHW